MKQTWKKITGLFLALACMLTLVCVPASASVEVTEDMKQSLISTIQTTIEQMAQADRDSMEGQLTSSTFTSDMVEKFYDAVEEAGAFEGVNGGEVTVNEEEETATVSLDVSFEKYDAAVTASVHYTSQSSDIDDIWYAFNIDMDYPMSVLMGQAAGNTVLGLGIVFVMLIFLCFVISLFKHINRAASPKEPQKQEAPKAPVVPAAEETAEDTAAEDEIAAVIAAAVAAYEAENKTGDGYVVRSIRKVSSKSWKRA